MEANVGEHDSYIRMAAGFLLAMTGIAGYAGVAQVAVGPLPQALTSAALLVLGLTVLVTGVVRKCGFYRVLGIDTCEK